ncbi:MAG: serine/threonine-protein kinase, partial [Rhodothermales bacterium]|nr:serine/threonine-protein kinase [Rhodothermales bacterium]
MTGTTLSHYKIVEELGRGGMGIVYLGEDTKLDRQVAIKVLPSSALASDDDRARFYREAKAAAALNHPNIAQIYQIDEAVPGDAPHGTQPSPFIAMEYIDGEPLDARIKRGPLKIKEAVRLASQIASALGEAHDKNIVHRDVKASNVMLTSKGDAKVLDFGLALTAASTKLTRMGSTLGTVAYMSPEQARGEEVDGRTDLWALGVVLYEMISGRNPFGGDYEQAVVYGILNAEPEPLTAVRTGVPMELERITEKPLTKDARHRYQAASGLIADLERLQVDLTKSDGTRLIPASVSEAGSVNTPISLLIPFAGGALLVLAVWGMWPATQSDTGVVYRLETSFDTNADIASADISQDGRTLVYATSTLEGGNVFVKNLTTGQVRRIRDAVGVQNVEFSSDGEWVLMTKQLSIERVSVTGGSPFEIVTTQEGNP